MCALLLVLSSPPLSSLPCAPNNSLVLLLSSLLPFAPGEESPLTLVCFCCGVCRLFAAPQQQRSSLAGKERERQDKREREEEADGSQPSLRGAGWCAGCVCDHPSLRSTHHRASLSSAPFVVVVGGWNLNGCQVQCFLLPPSMAAGGGGVERHKQLPDTKKKGRKRENCGGARGAIPAKT